MIDHIFEPSYTGFVCDVMVMRDGGGDQCGRPVAAHHQDPMFPSFEGAEVHASRLKISAGAALELDDIVAKVDDLVQVLVTVKVVGVHHDVHSASGQLVRVQLAKAQSCELWSVDG